jgi:adenylosuccinate lyase
MAAVRAGADRQEIHEAIRVHALAAGKRIKEEGAAENDLIARLRADGRFAKIAPILGELLEPSRFVGLAPVQATSFMNERVIPVLSAGGAVRGDTLTV